jgi:hypothetical protein
MVARKLPADDWLVVTLVAEYGMKGAADILGVADSTLKNYLMKVYRRRHVRGMAHAVLDLCRERVNEAVTTYPSHAAPSPQAVAPEAEIS